MDIKGSFNAYVVFKTEEAVTAALSANNQLWGTRHLRVDRMKPTLFDPKRSVFIGSLPHYTDEEDLRNHFAKVLPYGHDDIEGVRLVRDTETLVGKGIGYLLLRDRDAVMTALSLNDQMFKKIRKLRVTVCGKRTKRTGGSSGGGGSSGSSVTGNKRSSSSRPGDADEERQPKKPKKSSKTSPNLLNAKKRINLKSAITRNKALVAKKQKKATPGKKGKRLGGVVKRAMKAANTKKK
jgi:RNA recognition motif-containing protein